MRRTLERADTVGKGRRGFELPLFSLFTGGTRFPCTAASFVVEVKGPSQVSQLRN